MEKREIKFRAWAHGLSEMKQKFVPDNMHCCEWKVMQFTGFKDKNGSDIYESDFVSDGTSTHVVEFRYGCFMWNSRPLGAELFDNKYEYNIPSNWAEVIGNIYEHAHLLTTK